MFVLIQHQPAVRPNCVRVLTVFHTSLSQAEQAWLVYCAGTALTGMPCSWASQTTQSASQRLLANWWCQIRVRIGRSSGATESYDETRQDERVRRLAGDVFALPQDAPIGAGEAPPCF